MPHRVDDEFQPKRGATAGDLGEEAYRANLRRESPPGEEPAPPHGQAVVVDAGTVPIWKAPEAENPPPGQHKAGGPAVQIGQDVKEQGGVRRRPGTARAPK